jgi:hypothetical protein
MDEVRTPEFSEIPLKDIVTGILLFLDGAAFTEAELQRFLADRGEDLQLTAETDFEPPGDGEDDDDDLIASTLAFLADEDQLTPLLKRSDGRYLVVTENVRTYYQSFFIEQILPAHEKTLQRLADGFRKSLGSVPY